MKLKLFAIATVIALTACGAKQEEPKVPPKPTESVQTVPKTVEVCNLKSSDGTPIISSSGICYNAVNVVQFEPIKPAPKQEPKTEPIKETSIDPKPVVEPRQEQPKAPATIAMPKAEDIRKMSPPKVVVAKPTSKQFEPTLKPTKSFPKVDTYDIQPVLTSLNNSSVDLTVTKSLKMNSVATAELLFKPQEVDRNTKVILTAKLFTPQFSVLKLKSEDQPLHPTIPSQWNWELTPLATGVHEVVVTVSARIISPDGKEVEKYISTINKKIKVKETLGQRIYNFVTHTFTISLILIGAIITLIYFYKRK